MTVKERTLNCLIGISRENYRVQQAQSFIADTKADESIEEESKTELIAFADKVIEAEIKMTQETLEMVKKFGVSENIEPYVEEEEKCGFY
jgi:hypothetical protein